MILDQLENSARYERLNPRLRAAFEFLRKCDLKTLPLGKMVIDGENLFANVQEYTTKSFADAKLEAHRKYIDLQVLASGDEVFGWAPLSPAQTCVTPYTAKDDIAFYTGDFARIPLVAGQFAIFFPSDSHAPGRTQSVAKPVRKIFFKVLA